MKAVSSALPWLSLSFGLYLFSCDDDISRWYGYFSTDKGPDRVAGIIGTDLLGVWEEAVDTSLLYYSNAEHRIALLENDSFNIEVRSFTDAIDADDPCGFRWTHYASGAVVGEDPLIAEAAPRSSDTILLLRGSFTDSLYTQPTPNCRGEEAFDRLFSIGQRTNDTLQITFYRTSDQGETWETEVDLVRAEE